MSVPLTRGPAFGPPTLRHASHARIDNARTLLFDLPASLAIPIRGRPQRSRSEASWSSGCRYWCDARNGGHPCIAELIYAGGVDPRAGRRTVRVVLPEWLVEREHAISKKTYASDSALSRLIPPALAGLQIKAVTNREVTRTLIALNHSGLAASSVKRFRASLSSFFAWAVRERLIAANPSQVPECPRAVGSVPSSARSPRTSWSRSTWLSQRATKDWPTCS